MQKVQTRKIVVVNGWSDLRHLLSQRLRPAEPETRSSDAMRHNHKRIALGLLLASAALPATAQERQTAAPPPVTATPAPEAATPAPAPAPAPSPSITFAPSAPVVQNVPPPPAPPAEAAPAAAETRSVTRASRPTVSRPTASVRSTVTRSTTTARTTTAPVPVPTAAPAAAPSPTAAATAAPVAAAPEATAPEAAAPASAARAETSGNDVLLWAPIVIGGLVILGLIAYLLAARRRRTDDVVYEEEAYYAPVEEAPVAEPTHAEEAAVLASPGYVEPIYDAPAAAAATATDAARPWIDIGLRPIRAESDGALEVEVTVSNSGDVDARDVRVSTWMLNGAESSDGEQALIEARSGAQVATVNVAPGDDESVDTKVAMPAEASSPLLVAEARYPLPQGGEGRIAATFEIDMSDSDVEARLHDVLERA